MKHDINYTKYNHEELYSSFLKHCNIDHVQSFVPLYKTFFSINSNNWNSFSLNIGNDHPYQVIENTGINTATIKDISSNEIPVFIKYAPLLDPVKYMIGKYKSNTFEDIQSLPSFEKKHCLSKIDRENNSSYVDGFFTFLSSLLLTKCKFVHGVRFHGTFIGLHKEFTCNLEDDIDYIEDSEYFFENKDKLFTLENGSLLEMLNFDTRKFKEPLKRDSKRILEQKALSCKSTITEDEWSSLWNENERNSEKVDNNKNSTDSCSFKTFYSHHSIVEKDDSSDNESAFDSDIESDSDSDSENELEECDMNENDDGDEDESDKNSEGNDDDDDDDDEEVLRAKVFNIPVNIILMERLDSTLDAYMTEHELTVDEWSSVLMQVIMTLITYQDVFSFTHNDLHTNNIMFSETDKQYLYYKYGEKYYKVPTYGKIYKIIDFGRGIYTYRNKLICSDNYEKNEDAYTQYNFGPIYDSQRTKREPNPAFDLCRLGCSMIDEFVTRMDELDKVTHPIGKLIVSWTTDDNGRNILYKTNGKERFEGFKLYKMIAKLVHKHTPHAQLENPLFSQFKVKKSIVKGKKSIMDIDSMINPLS